MAGVQPLHAHAGQQRGQVAGQQGAAGLGGNGERGQPGGTFNSNGAEERAAGCCFCFCLERVTARRSNAVRALHAAASQGPRPLCCAVIAGQRSSAVRTCTSPPYIPTSSCSEPSTIHTPRWTRGSLSGSTAL